jgi:hypothetical protein
MKKNVIKLTEHDLHKIIKESVREVLSEAVFNNEYQDNTIPNDLSTIFYYARSWYKSALDELKSKNYLFPETLGHLQDEVIKLQSVIMNKGRSNCPENLLKVYEGMKNLLNEYGRKNRN